MSSEAGYPGDAQEPCLPVLGADGQVMGALCVFCHGRLVHISELSARWMGAESVEEILGRSFTDIVPPDQVAAFADLNQYLHKPGDRTPRLPSTMVRLDGARVDGEVVVTLTDWEGAPAFQVEIYDIAQRSAVEKSVEYQSAMIEHASDALIATTFNGVVTSWNPAAAALFGTSADDALGRPITEAADSRMDLRAIVSKGGVDHIEIGEADAVVCIRLSVSAMHIGYVVVCADNTALRRAERRFQAILDTLDGGIIVVGPDGTIESANPAAVAIYGADPRGRNWEELTATTLPVTYNTAGRQLGFDPIARTREDGTPLNGLIMGFDRKPSQRIWVSLSCRRLDPGNPADSTVMVSVTDFTEHQIARERLAHAATHDDLTGLFNRAQLLRLLEEALVAHDDRVRAVLFVDLDNLKSINDSLGHAAGDYVLQMAARRLVDSVGPDNVVGRHGGDEFVCLLHISVGDDLDRVCDHIHETLARPIEFDSIALLTGASIGVRVLRDDDTEAIGVLADADVAMYEAKAAGRSQTRLFTRR